MLILQKSNLTQINDWLSSAMVDGSAALIDKDKSWTSFDVVNKLRYLFKVKKVGHAGTLDPLATGLLILCFGKATKTIDSFQGMKKKYTGIIKLGATTKTDDSEGEEENIKSIENISEAMIEHTVSLFQGKIMQKPPMFSAKSVNGTRLYKLARKNIEVEILPVEVEINGFKITDYKLPYLTFEIECSKGTYIRSIARDLGEKLGCGAYLSELRRTAIGDYNVTDAVTIDQIKENFQIT
jgi:tRNA pseudouridine55 synthase